MMDWDKRMRQLGRLTKKATEKAREKASELEEIANDGEGEDADSETRRRRDADDRGDGERGE